MILTKRKLNSSFVSAHYEQVWQGTQETFLILRMTSRENLKCWQWWSRHLKCLLGKFLVKSLKKNCLHDEEFLDPPHSLSIPFSPIPSTFKLKGSSPCLNSVVLYCSLSYGPGPFLPYVALIYNHRPERDRLHAGTFLYPSERLARRFALIRCPMHDIPQIFRCWFAFFMNEKEGFFPCLADSPSTIYRTNCQQRQKGNFVSSPEEALCKTKWGTESSLDSLILP